MKHLIIGGARSGKSRYAESCALATQKQLHYIATAQARDDEMQQRISHHQAQRDATWHLHEEATDLGPLIDTLNSPSNCIVVDCLTLWLNNSLEQDCWGDQKSRLLNSLENLEADIVLVGNEVGGGIVPLGELSRVFVDENGRLHQELAEQCSHVSTVIAGLPLALKEPNTQ